MNPIFTLRKVRNLLGQFAFRYSSDELRARVAELEAAVAGVVDATGDYCGIVEHHIGSCGELAAAIRKPEGGQ